LEWGFKGTWPWPEKEYRNEGIRQGDDKGDLKGIEILNEKKGHEQSTDDGPDALKDVDFSNGGDIFSDVSGIEFTSVSEKGTLGKCHREKDQEGGVENCCKTKSLSGGSEKDISKYSGEIDGHWKGCRKKQLEEHKDLYFTFYFFYGFSDDKRTNRHQDEPVGENDSEGELVAMKRDEEFPHQDDLGDDTAQSLKEKGDFEGLDVHCSLLKLKFGVRSLE
jgi:hypothetical protein